MRNALLAAVCTSWLAQAAAPAPAPAAQAAPVVGPGLKGGILLGTIAERLDAAGYSYLRVEAGGTSQWAAVPVVSGKVGDPVRVAVQTEMKDFQSVALKRRFERVYFGTVEGAQASPPSSGAAEARKELPPGHPAVGTTGAPAAKPELPPGHPPSSPPTPAPAMGSFALVASGLPAFDAVAKEVLQVPGYTYLRVDAPDGEAWVAVPSATLTAGAAVRIENPSPMHGFNSRALNRTFQKLFFATLGAPPSKAPKAAGK